MKGSATYDAFLMLIQLLLDQWVSFLPDVLEKAGRDFPFLPEAGHQEVKFMPVCVCVSLPFTERLNNEN